MATPFGVHLWFDPSVESVVLLSEPVNFLCVSEDGNKKKVDTPAQMSILGEYTSESGQADGADSVDSEESIVRSPGGVPGVPF